MNIKEEVLKKLIKNKDKSPVSGQKLAADLNVSRNAIWKAINSLKEQGYVISSATNLGYMLTDSKDILSQVEIEMHLDDKEVNVMVFEEIDSTNTYAKQLISKGFTDKALIVANSQTKGRGRYSKSFYSPSDTGIYMSYVIHPMWSINDFAYITTCSAVAICMAIEKLAKVTPSIKWVNDIYINDKKVCGILTEAISDFEAGIVESIIIGIGINITTSDFPDEIGSVAGAISSEGISRNFLAAEIANRLNEIFNSADKTKYMDYYRKNSYILGKKIFYLENNNRIDAEAIDIDDTGGLIVKHSDGSIKTLRSGEISVRLIE